MSEKPAPLFLIESDLDELESLRKIIANDRQIAHAALGELSRRLDEQDARVYLGPIASALEALHGFLVAALDARTAELAGEAPDD